MKETILRCDRCPKEQRKFAVTTLELSNGRKGGPTLDLCAVHEREVRKFFKAVTTSKRDSSVRARVLNYVTKHEGTNAPDIQRELKIMNSSLHSALTNLQATKDIKKTGKYRKATYRKA